MANTQIQRNGTVTIQVKIKGTKVQAMIDNAADKNLIDPELRKMLQIRTKERANPLIAKDIQRREINRITHETEEVWMNTGQHSEQITFQEMHQARYKITLGREWLEQHNPEID